jgi:[1-hydroxy-2-(trimethylamino)ethyl]phosphonate dioxygenase
MKREDAAIAAIDAAFRRRGGDHYGEGVSQQEHALQAAWLAEREGASPALIVAALLHDIGHLLHDLPEDIADQEVDTEHESLGSAWLSQYFGPAVSEPVRLHVAAKRYLCAAEPGYLDQLSAASQESLALQGGPVDAAAAAAFRAAPGAEAAIRLRRWDDGAKIVGLATPGLAHFCGYVAAAIAAPGPRGSADTAPAARSSAG